MSLSLLKMQCLWRTMPVVPCKEPHINAGFLSTIWLLRSSPNTALRSLWHCCALCLKACAPQKAYPIKYDLVAVCPRGCLISPKSAEKEGSPPTAHVSHWVCWLWKSDFRLGSLYWGMKKELFLLLSKESRFRLNVWGVYAKVEKNALHIFLMLLCQSRIHSASHLAAIYCKVFVTVWDDVCWV